MREEIYASERPLSGRPPLFRALGRWEPPCEIFLGTTRYARTDIIKHDSWAATAVYANDRKELAACKFNRTQWLFLLPGRWAGRWLARKEQSVLQLMKGVEGFPRWMGPVSANGMVLHNAVSHEWISGRSFDYNLKVNDAFFPRLQEMLGKLHAQGIAYVDMSKRENIIAGTDGRPYLIDFQIHYRPRLQWLSAWWLRRLQSADRFYLLRHWLRTKPEQFSSTERTCAERPPGIVTVAESLGHPLRSIRRAILALAGVAADKKHKQGFTESKE